MNAAPEKRRILVAGSWEESQTPLDVVNPYDGSVFATTFVAGEPELERATRAAVAAAPAMRRLAAYERSEILARACDELRRRREEIGRTIASEVGKALRDALGEADRGALTFQAASEEARRIAGDEVPIDLAPHGRGRIAFTRRFPIGPVAAISPFNFPFNLAAHKLAPAVAAGNPVVLKPASKTPLSALVLAEALDRAGLPKGALSVLPMARATGDRLVTDERFKLLTFTGSSAVGWGMKARAGRKKVVLELGGNAGVIVDESADLDLAAGRVASGGFALAGQSCISVQRVFVHARVFDRFASMLVDRAEALKVGDPLDPATEVGPMVDEGEAERVEAWVGEAVAAGARVLTGGKRLGGALYAPTVLSGVPVTARVCAEEVFAPLVGLYPFDDFDRAIDEVNRSSYGLQAGVFTNDLRHALAAFDGIEAGGVMVNDVSSWRMDNMPYGGVKDSGLGREGPRYAIEEMTETKIVVINGAR
ncbi:MAG: safD [Acidobacteria bacterium]|nr:safD [Acidobacteriota bacterium]